MADEGGGEASRKEVRVDASGHGHGHGHGGGAGAGAGGPIVSDPPAASSFDPSLDEVDLTNERLGELPDLSQCRHGLRVLTLRVNAIARLDAARLDLPALETLDLYGNRIERPDPAAPGPLAGLPSLTYLDLSFNELREPAALRLADAPQLRELYLIGNKVQDVPPGAFGGLPRLRVLELGSNRLRAVGGLEPLAAPLEELYLGRNKITEISGLASLVGLRKLSLQANRLTAIGGGLAALVSLEELYLSQNGIERVDGLSALLRLRVLDLGHNRLKRVEGLEPLVELRDLWLNHNHLESLDDLAVVAGAQRMETLYLEANPLQSAADYRERVLAVFPRLKQLDAEVLVEDDEMMVDA